MPENPKTLFLLDAYALIYRAHFAFSKNPRVSSKGRNTGVMFGFTNTLLEVLQKREPSHIAVAFDTSHPTFRHEVFDEYKANRQETPEDVRQGIPIVKDIIKGFNIPILELPGYEADDIIGTVAKKASTKGFKVYMMTPDKDFGQLVEENIILYKPAYMGNSVDELGIEEIKEKWGIDHVDQVRDMLGLQGDSSDNIPGIPGVGPKTAQKYIKEYGTVENLVAHASELKGKQKENMELYGEQGILSKELATIKIDVPIEVDLDSFEYRGPEENLLKPIFEELEFRTLIQRVFGSQTQAINKIAPGKSQLDLFSAGSSPEAKNEPNKRPELDDSDDQTIEEKPKYDLFNSDFKAQVVDTEAELSGLIKYLKAQPEIAMTIEQNGYSVDAEIIGIGFSYYKSESYFIPIEQKDIDRILGELKVIFEDPEKLLIGHDLKANLVLLRKYGLEVKCRQFDVMLLHYLLDPDIRHSIDILSENFLNYYLLGDRKASINELQDRAARIGEQAMVIGRVRSIVDESHDVFKLFSEVEMPLSSVLEEMEFHGVKVDTKVLAKLSSELEKSIQDAQKEVFDLAGEEFNIGSPKQLGVVLFEKLKLLEKPKKTKSGQYATGEEVLSKLAGEHAIVQRILDFREYQKLKSTYVDALPALVSSFDSRLHTTFSQAVAATGRLSSNNPNLQNIPIRTARGREIRTAFVPRDKDYILLSADYSQIELRIMASFSEDEHMMQAFNEGRDIHTATASRIFKVPIDEVDKDMRGKAKSANFGIIYGISAFGLSQNLNIPRKEAADIIESYFNEFPAVKRYMDNSINEARELGYVQTILGRKRFLRDINSRNVTTRGYAERNAINAPIQGSAADMIKMAMIQIHDWMKSQNLKSKMILQVHDELVFDAHKSELDLLKKNVIHYMRTALPLKVPIEVGVGQGENWLDAH